MRQFAERNMKLWSSEIITSQTNHQLIRNTEINPWLPPVNLTREIKNTGVDFHVSTSSKKAIRNELKAYRVKKISF